MWTLQPALNSLPLMAFKTNTSVATPQLDDRTKLSHRSLDAITPPSECCALHKHHSIGIMAPRIYPALLLYWFIIWFIITLSVPQALLGCSVQHGHHPLIHATFTCLSAALCPHTALHYLCLPASHINPLPCLEDREALHAGDEDAMLGQKAIFPSPLKLAIMALT